MSASRFDTPAPISVVLDLYAADVRFTVSDRADTVVELRPSGPDKAADAKAVANTTVEYDEAGRTLSVVSRKPLNRFVNWSSKRPESIELLIQLPAGSEVRGEAEYGDFHAEGVLGAVAFKSGIGEIRLAETGPVNLRGGVGAITVGRVVGAAQVQTGSSDVRLGLVEGTLDVTNGNGKVRVGLVGGCATVKCSNGTISVDRALSDITVTGANGEVRIGEVVRGKVSATTKNGSVEVGVREGSAALLELDTTLGRVYNELGASAAPAAGEPVDKVELIAGTKLGDITIRRTARLEDQA
ncbi:hypothetical protein DN069_18970 [Streptacidiphilus pinicola]|uniref:Adhesin domain-containing protein n=1 Tax=Streptacidiphilus pinicola TaxID=2219663 RepID=A0A2X0K9F6_9ACTN|nr:DUF4097 family beta strand repeat-containing protein [Streptacidiphilus pinicola]RAG84119.1 hypothetical protein DN069_18970 [Streptacidiphilus pinicola]